MTSPTDLSWSLKFQLTFLAGLALFGGLLVVLVVRGASPAFEGPVSTALFGLHVTAIFMVLALVAARRPGNPDLRPHVDPGSWPGRREIAFGWAATGLVGGVWLACAVAPDTPARALALSRVPYITLILGAGAGFVTLLDWVRGRMARWLLRSGYGLGSLTRLVPMTDEDRNLRARLEAQDHGREDMSA